MKHLKKTSLIEHSVLRASVLAASLGLAALAGCTPRDAKDTEASMPAKQESAVSEVAAPPAPGNEGLRLALAAQPDEIKARFDARHPAETLTFFGIEAGMTVIEGDPGVGGWYSGILQAYLGDDGTLVGADYPLGVYELFNYYSEEELAAKVTWPETWPAQLLAKLEVGPAVQAYTMGSMPETLEGTADAALLIRLLHNLADFEDEGAYLSNGLAELYRALKPGGIVGVVQHLGPETHSDEWASGANGYLKKSFVIAAMEAAGFVFEAESPINENPLDQPTEDESVWRLAPTSEFEDPDMADTYAAIGESNRMTLRFRKPAES